MVEAIAYCESVKDYVSREIFVDILDDTEEHIDWLETQLELIDKVGSQNYLQSQMEPEGEYASSIGKKKEAWASFFNGCSERQGGGCGRR